MTLSRGTDPVALSHRAVALLRILIDRAGALVTKDVLMEAAWPGLAVEDSNLTVQISALRRALREVPGGESWIATLPRRGYRFVGPAVTKSEAPATPTVDAATRQAPMMALALPDKPSIAVLAFDNLSGDPEQGYFVDGMVEEIITALSRIRWLFVIARNSSFTYKGRAVDVKQVGRELGVLYVLEGSVRRAGNRIRISAQLLDATNGAHLWADRFDAKLDDVFELQDNVASSVAGVIEPTLLLLWLQEHPNWAPCLRFLASCYAHLGRMGDAKAIVEKLKSITPDLVPSADHWRIRKDREYYLDGLRMAVGVNSLIVNDVLR